MQAMKHASEGIHFGYQTQNIFYQKSKTGVSMTPEKNVIQKFKKNVFELKVDIIIDIL